MSIRRSGVTKRSCLLGWPISWSRCSRRWRYCWPKARRSAATLDEEWGGRWSQESSAPSARLVCCSRSEPKGNRLRSEEHTSELQSRSDLVCRLLLEKKKKKKKKK